MYQIDLFEARDYRREPEEKAEELEENYNEQKDQDEKRLAELNQQKQEIYDSADWN